MKKYDVSATVTVSVFATVEANTAEEAREIAASLEMPNFCYGCSQAHEGFWGCSELDGEACEITIEGVGQ